MEEREEKQKSKFRLKWENYWYHYKWQTWLCVGLLIALGYGIKEFAFRVKPDLTVALATNLYISDAQYNQLKENIAEYVEDFNEDGEVVVQLLNISFPSEMGESDSAQLYATAQARLNAEFASNDTMLFIFNSTVYKQEKAAEGMEDLTTIFPQLELEEPKRYPLNDTALLEGQVFNHFPSTLFFTLRDRDTFIEYRGEDDIEGLDNAQKTLERIINGEKV